jgi:hypothetical protein
MIDHRKEMCNLLRTLLGSTCTHVASSISNETNRFAYVKAMSRCHYMCLERQSGNDIYAMKTAVEKLLREVPKDFQARVELFSSTKEYYTMGVAHSLDAVKSILVRFEKGYSHNDEWFVRNMLEKT